MNPLLVLAIGIGVVFFGLFCLIGIIYLMSFIYRVISGERRLQAIESKKVDLSEIMPSPARTSIPEAKLSPEQRRSLIAAVSVAVAEYMGTDPEALRICSIRRTSEAYSAGTADRRELMAAISAAIASQLDTDVSAIRIHSIKRV